MRVEKPALDLSARAAVWDSVNSLVPVAAREAIEEWFALPQRCLGGCRPCDFIASGRGELVVFAAQRAARGLQRRRRRP